jgi:DNA modification methylase
MPSRRRNQKVFINRITRTTAEFISTRTAKGHYEGNGYWPTIFYAPKERVQQHSLAKNADAITDLIGSFDVSSVADLFAGSGTVGMSAFELNLDCTLVEHDKENCKNIANYFKFMGANFNKEGF